MSQKLPTNVDVPAAGNTPASDTASPTGEEQAGLFAESDSGTPEPATMARARFSEVVPKNPNQRPEGLNDLQILCHELGNELGAAMNASNVVQAQLKQAMRDDETLREGFAILDQSHMGLWHIIKRVRTSTNGALQSPKLPAVPEEIPEYTVQDLSEILQAEIKRLRRTLRMNISIRRNIADGVKILGEPFELHEIFYNILKNAYEIMKVLPESERKVHVCMRRVRGKIEVVISDNGPGFTNEILLKLFSRGFTTKNGKGIGLNYSLELAQKMGGDIVAMNNRDLHNMAAADDDIGGEDLNGAAFVVEFPVVEDDAT